MIVLSGEDNWNILPIVSLDYIVFSFNFVFFSINPDFHDFRIMEFDFFFFKNSGNWQESLSRTFLIVWLFPLFISVHQMLTKQMNGFINQLLAYAIN